jgi:poly-gamma-glutamate biosynthesis protein PgsC/CapC
MSPEAHLVIGVVLSILFLELTGISPGGLIVPGYAALFLSRPDRLALSAGIALATVWAVRFAGRYLVLFGRRRFAVFILAGFAIRAAAEALLPGFHPSLGGLEAVGWLLPGIVASDLDRQGVLRTFPALAAVTALVKLAALAFPGSV